ncbi:hypothetical protein FQN60_014586 [Etheostoma spectabile]|uniref:beta-ketoacyl-[acyl-carrier-protein] synthase I n=1 Tax=Etheostoma spectabile TaxID=54343 RepID=A0A5J5D7D4_9PERO|nr:hypothetical protein FQN60_014586 [Etheostoma spectabile]
MATSASNTSEGSQHAVSHSMHHRRTRHRRWQPGLFHGDAVAWLQGERSPVGALSMAGLPGRAPATQMDDNPTQASRPFHPGERGLRAWAKEQRCSWEELTTPWRRGARIYAEILGYGLSGDASHITAPTADEDGAFRCMVRGPRRQAFPGRCDVRQRSRTSTPLGDAAGKRPIKRLFQQSLEPWLSPTREPRAFAGGAGALEAAFTALACYHGGPAQTLNLERHEPEFSLNYVPAQRSRGTLGPTGRLTQLVWIWRHHASLVVTSVVTHWDSFLTLDNKIRSYPVCILHLW